MSKIRKCITFKKIFLSIVEIVVEISGSVREEFFPLPFLIRTKKKKMSLSSDPQAFLRSFGEKKTFDCALWRCFRLIKTSWRIIPQYRLLDFFLCIRVDCSSSRLPSSSFYSRIGLEIIRDSLSSFLWSNWTIFQSIFRVSNLTLSLSLKRRGVPIHLSV